jgi:uncharacterized protein (TIGR02118 family)
MAGVKLVVLYPYPDNVEEFERVYRDEHMPLVNERTVKGITKFVGTKILGSADGSRPQYHRIAELHFPDHATLTAALSSEGGQKAAAHAVSISSGGAPVFLVGEEQSDLF